MKKLLFVVILSLLITYCGCGEYRGGGYTHADKQAKSEVSLSPRRGRSDAKPDVDGK